MELANQRIQESDVKVVLVVHQIDIGAKVTLVFVQVFQHFTANSVKHEWEEHQAIKTAI
jgi:hypothetical protein